MIVLLQETITFGSNDASGWTKILPIIISSLALAVSLFTLYLNYLGRFKALITVGAPVYQFGIAVPNAPGLGSTFTAAFDPKRGRVLAAILLPIVFTHETGRPGVISDLMVRVSRVGKKDNWFFEPRLNFNEHAYVTSFDPKTQAQSVESAFSPIPVGRGDQINRFVLFQADINETFPVGRLRLDHYTIDVLCRINNREYKLIETIAVDFTSEVLTSLDSGRYVPPPKLIADARDTLRQMAT
jgi:hypothetical protein